MRLKAIITHNTVRTALKEFTTENNTHTHIHNNFYIPPLKPKPFETSSKALLQLYFYLRYEMMHFTYTYKQNTHTLIVR